MNIMHHKLGRDPHYKIWHTIDGAMILFVYSGCGSIVLSEKILPLERGTLCLITPDRQHYTMPEAPESYDRSKIFVSKRTYRTILENFSKNDRFTALFSSGTPVYAKIPEDKMCEAEFLFKRANERMNNGAGQEAIIGSFLSLMDYISEYTEERPAIGDTLMSRALDYINKSFKGPMSLDGICGHLHISKYHFSRKFKEALRMTLMEYVSKTRMAAAEELLTYTSLSVGDVAEQSGFSSLAYFSRLFKSQHGITPGKYRKNNQHI